MIIYWDTLEKNAADTRTIPEYIQTQLPYTPFFPQNIYFTKKENRISQINNDIEAGFDVVVGNGIDYFVDKNIYFNNPFTDYPIVVCNSAGGTSPVSPSELYELGLVNSVSVVARITKSGFLVRYMRVNTHINQMGPLSPVGYYGFTWIAVGKKNR